jgi:hypothetical protein
MNHTTVRDVRLHRAGDPEQHYPDSERDQQSTTVAQASKPAHACLL